MKGDSPRQGNRLSRKALNISELLGEPNAYSVWPSMNSRKIEVGGIAAISTGERTVM